LIYSILYPARGEDLAVLDKMIREANAEYYAQARLKEKIVPVPAGVSLDARCGFINFHADRFHFTNLPHNSPKDGAIGGYVCSLVIYSTLNGKSPVGLSATIKGERWEQFDPVADAELIHALQETVWKVVSSHALTGDKP